MENVVLNHLTNKLAIFNQNSDMFFEQYATDQMIDLLNSNGLNALKESLQGAINAKGVHPVAKMFFMDVYREIVQL